MLTQAQQRALEIIRHNGRITPGRFADLMWPDSPGHNRIHKCGSYGASKGVMMAMAGGGYLGKLWKRGLIRPVFDGYIREWVITHEGLGAEAEARGRADTHASPQSTQDATSGTGKHEAGT